MILKTRDGRKVEVTDIDYGKEVENTFIAQAFYLDVEDDNEAIVPDNVLDELLEDYAAEVDEAWYDYQCGRGEDYGDWDR